MKQMKTASARTLTWFAAALIGVGCIIMSPSAAFLSLTLAALVAFFPAVFGKGKVRILASVLLLVSIALSVDKYTAFKHEQAVYRKQAISYPQKQPRPD